MFTGLRMGRIGVVLGLAVLIGIAAFGNGGALGPLPAEAGLAPIEVNTLNDEDPIVQNGQCSLREAIMNANENAQTHADCEAGAGGDLIFFSVSGEITLLSDLPEITDDAGLQIDGAGEVTVSGNGAYRPFTVESGTGFHGVLTLKDLTVTDGYSDQDGGGIYSRGDLTLINTTVTGNNADRHGGGIFVGGIGSSNVTMIDSTLSGNIAGSGRGGGIYFTPVSGEASITRSTFSGNVSGNGGGGISAHAGTLTIANSTLSGNNGAGFGGGMSTNTATVLINNTITDNLASVSGGGVRVGPAGDVTLTNTIVADQQSGGDCGGLDVVAGWTSGGHNLDSDGTCELTADGDIPNGNANLGPLEDNGGPTLTHALLGGSDAIDAGDDDVCAAEPVDGVDQRGVERPQGAACDIGAFEATPLWGDVDCDGGVAIGDALKIARHLLGLSVGQEPGCPAIGSDVKVDGEERTWGDADCDGGVAIGDALKTARWLLGLSVSQEPGCPEIGDSIGLG